MFVFNREKLKELLFKNNVQQKELAMQVGVSYTTINQIALGYKKPSFDLACRISRALNTTVDSFAKAE